MLSIEEATRQANIMTLMLEVSPYFDDVDIVITERESNYTIFAINDSLFIEVRDNDFGFHQYLPGYYKDIGDNTHKVYLSVKESIYQSCMRIVAFMYDLQLRSITSEL